ncbi:MAG TPA: cell wall hydrolase [Brevundimonas sp.]|nr:cell wall hydrolase [Brevundimonas sp.]
MIRFTAAATAVVLAAAPVLAQTTPPQAPVRAAASPSSPAPGTEEWLRLRGETYRAAPDSEQDPAEVARTIKLNSEIAARNQAADRADAEAAATFERQSAQWREEAARLETQRVQWEADAAAAEAARLRYERDRAAWEAEVAACQRNPRGCVVPARPSQVGRPSNGS